MRITRSDVTVVVPTKNEVGNIETFLASVPDDVARIPWLLFTDADVALHPEYFERLAAADLLRRWVGLL